MMRSVVVAAAAMLVLAGCGNDDPLADDPEGQEACDQLVTGLESTGDVAKKIEALTLAAEAAGEAETDAIKETLNEPIEGLEDIPTVDIEKLSDACEDAGIDVPDVPKVD